MEKITAFKLTDGQIIEDEEKAIRLQREISIKNNLLDLCEFLWGSDNAEEMALEIYRKRDQFIAALTGSKL